MNYEESQWIKWMDILSEDNIVVIDDFLSLKMLAEVHLFFDGKLLQNSFKKAAIGKGLDQKEDSEVRGDYIYWLNRDIDLPLAPFFALSDEMISNFNKFCYLSLKNSEYHLAEYPIGSFYKKHMDQFIGTSNRIITFLLYLNVDWQASDEGQLRVYNNEQYEDISPLNNRCLLFKSDKVLHEVLPTQCVRRSLTGWLLFNN